MKVSASLYSNKDKPLEELVKELDRYHVDFLHIDCNDDLAIFNDICRVRKISATPIDLHVISGFPEKFFEGIEKNGVELVSFQYENLKNGFIPPLIDGTRCGLAISTGTDIRAYQEYRSGCDFVLFMATEPGKSGGVFNTENFNRIRRFRNLYPAAKIHVDGGVNDEISFALRNMGVSLVVSGSYLVNAPYPGAALQKMHSDNISSHILVEDFMIRAEESPVLVKGSYSFRDILHKIEKFNMGFTVVVTPDGFLEGMITNADVRRGLLKFFDDSGNTNIQYLDADALTNRNPVKVLRNQSVTEMLSVIKKANFPVLYLPVTDFDNRFCGSLTFANLIKGE